MKNLIIAGLFAFYVMAFLFITPKDFNLQEFLVNAKAQGVTLYKSKASDPMPDGYITLINGKLNVRMYDAELKTPELKASLQALVNAATSLL